MSFEIIKTIKGHKYGYTVESYREEGKNKQRILKYHGRMDKEPIGTNALTIPYGFYYFSQEECSACDSQKQVEDELGEIKRYSGEEIPQIIYVNLSKEKMPVKMYIEGTPTICGVGKTGLFFKTGGSVRDWAYWHFGKKKAAKIFDAIKEEDKQKMTNILKENIRAGMKLRALRKTYEGQFLSESAIRALMEEVANEKLTGCKDGVVFIT